MKLTKARIGAVAAGLAAVMAALGELVHRDGVEAGLIVAIFAIAALAVLLLGLLAVLLVRLAGQPAPRRRPKKRRHPRRKGRRVELRDAKPAR